MNATRILGENTIPAVAAFNDVRVQCDALGFYPVLGAHVAKLVNEDISGNIVYNMEPLYPGCRSFSIGYLDVLRQTKVVDYSRVNVKYLASLGIPALYAPYGYHTSLERVVPKAKSIEILLFGSHNPRRECIVGELKRYFDITWVCGVYGAELDSLVAKAVVHLNVHFCDDHPLEVARINYLLANRCTVVSEKSNDPIENKKYDDGLFFAEGISGLIHACKSALRTPRDGYECMRQMPTDFTEARLLQ